MKITSLRDQLTEKDRNIEKLLHFQMKNHAIGTAYSDEYLDEIRKIMKSPTGKYGWSTET